MSAEILRVTIPGPPYGKARHRTTRTGIQYTPKETVAYENLVKTIFRAAYAMWAPNTAAPFRFLAVAYYPIPKSVSKSIRQRMIEGHVRPTKRPDWDNVGKIITDSLNEIVYRDDAQICDGRVVKFYGEIPRVEFEFAEIM